MKKHLTAILTVAFCMVVSQLVSAATNEPLDFLKSKNEQLQKLAQNADANRAKMVDVLNQLLDFGTLCQESLGKQWAMRSPSERDEYSKHLRALIERNIINRLKDGSKTNVTYDASKPQGDKVAVSTTVGSATDPRAEKTQIVYLLKRNAASWGVVDMITDDVSLVENYRVEFNKIINESGWNGLIQKMKDELAKPPAP